MQLIFFIVLVGVVYADTTNSEPADQIKKDTPVWANEDKFGGYQDAWATINKPNVDYYLVSATYNKSETFGENFSCVKVQTTSVHAANKSVDAEMKYKDEKKGIQTLQLRTKAIKEYNYIKKENALEYGSQADKGTTGQHAEARSASKAEVGTLVFSDPNRCDLVSVNDGDDMELWVNEDVKDQVPPCCLFLLDYFKPSGKPTHKIYISKEECHY
uniref:Putative group vi salivary lipocalin n=1 Tax=Rhipicephalus pulchellus TaxID=72859 RepID=L7LQP3_RHIPC